MKSLGRNKIFHHESQAGCIVSVWDAWILDLVSPRTHKGKIVKKITDFTVSFKANEQASEDILTK